MGRKQKFDVSVDGHTRTGGRQMNDIKQTIAKNISELRKAHKFTQAELAERLNYSDKAVSKWERAESIPDVMMLQQIASMFGVTVDYLLTSEHVAKDHKAETSKAVRRNRLIISLLSVSLVFLIVTIAYVTLGLVIKPLFGSLWTLYIYALPVATIVAIVFNAIWGRRKWTFVLVTVLMWSVLLVIYIACMPINNVWPIFLIGIPGQLIILLWSGLRK